MVEAMKTHRIKILKGVQLQISVHKEQRVHRPPSAEERSVLRASGISVEPEPSQNAGVRALMTIVGPCTVSLVEISDEER
jgi:hypothetical protein